MLRFILRLTLSFLLINFAPNAYAHPANEREAALLFRKIFAKNSAATYTPEEIQKLIFLPNHAVLDRQIGQEKTVEDVLAQHRLKLQTLRPSHLFQEAAETPDPPADHTVKHPVTIVIIPGIFGEFIDHIPYEELLSNKQTAFARVWQQAAADAGWTDPVFDLETLSLQDKPLSELVDVGSIDDEHGQPQTKIILLKAPKASLESLGTLAESAAIYQRRLDKIFTRLGIPEHAYFLGYSRGLTVGLELVSTTDAKTHPWFQGFRGLIGLGGVTYGSAVADQAIEPATLPGKVFSRIKQLAEELEVPETQSAEIMLRNTQRWTAALSDLAGFSSQLPEPEGLKMENIQSDGASLGFMARTFKEIALDKFQLDRPWDDYARNIQRFKLFARESFEGVQSISTDDCLNWMKTHTLPEQLHYYAITTVMPDPSTADRGVSPLTANSLAYESTGLDYKSLRTSYYTYFEVSGMMANDSQISLDRSPFWPELHQLANPAQKPFPATLLAVLGTDHWGMAFPVAFETQSGKVNPFPRSFLMQTLGEFLGSTDD